MLVDSTHHLHAGGSREKELDHILTGEDAAAAAHVGVHTTEEHAGITERFLILSLAAEVEGTLVTLLADIDVGLEEGVEEHHPVHTGIIEPFREMEDVGVVGAQLHTHGYSELFFYTRDNADLLLLDGGSVKVEPCGDLVEV